jgi:RNA polymerase sigma-70 factor, ECF subfamily
MTQDVEFRAPDLEQFRPYLKVLALSRISPCLRDRVDPSGIVQETFLEAVKDWPKRRGPTTAECAAWLRGILAHNLTDAMRRVHSDKRDVRRELHIEDQLERSAAGLANLLPAEQSSPSNALQREERAIRVASAVMQLDERQRTAIDLRYWHEWHVVQIAEHLETTTTAVAGLLKRGLKKLKETLAAEESI